MTRAGWSGNFQLVWSPSSRGLSDFQKCPRYYWLRHVRRLRRSGSNAHTAFGTAVHAGLEAYYACPGDGQERLREALRGALVSAEADGLPMEHQKHKTRQRLTEALVAWHDELGVDTDYWLPLWEGASEQAVEVPLWSDIARNGQVVMAGTIDRVLEYGGRPVILDTKTTGSYESAWFFDRFRPDTQISTYVALAQRCIPELRPMAFIDAFFITAGGVSVRRELIQVLDASEALADASYWIGQAHACAAADSWPANRQSCHHYGGCEFVSVCREAPGNRERILRSDYEVQPDEDDDSE